MRGQRRVERQRNADQARIAGLGSDNFKFAAMILDDFSADGQAQPQADIARREKRRVGRGDAMRWRRRWRRRA